MQAIQNKIIKKSTLYIIYGVFIALFGTIVFNYNAVFADTSVNYNVQIEQALNVTVSSNTISLDLNPESKQFGTEDLSVSVGTNYINGYKLYIRSNSTDLTNSAVSSTIPTLASTTPASSFPANYWGYRISSGATGDSSITDENYHEFTSGTLVSSSTTAINNNTSVLTFAAKANYDKPAGIYANTFTFNATINPVTYSITYADNTGDSTVANLPSFGGDSTNHTQTGMIENGVAPISSTVPTRTGYTFRAWCKGTVSNSGTTCTGTEYNAGSNLDLSTSLGPDTTDTLYAAWNIDSYTITIANSNTASNPASSVSIPYGGSATVTVTPSSGYTLNSVSCPSGYTCTGYNTGITYTGQQTVTVTNNNTDAGGTLAFIGARPYLQDVTSSYCTATAKTVYDSRDEQSYIIQRLGGDNGNCWMMTNLNLGATNISTNLTSSNTNLPAGGGNDITAATFNGWKKSSGTGTLTAAELIPVSGTDSTSGTPYGTLYNFCAASAGTICSNTNSSDAQYDLCPAGWKLPTSSVFAPLYYTGYSNLRASIANGGAAFALAGLFDGAPTEQGSFGVYWLPARADNTSMGIIFFDTSSVNPGGMSITRDGGGSIRCILKSV